MKNPAVEMKTLPKDDYIALLESNYQAQSEINRLKGTLQAEYNFAEEKIKEIKKLEEKVKEMDAFIKSDNAIKCKYRNYKAAKKNIKELKDDSAEDDGIISGGFDDHE